MSGRDRFIGACALIAFAATPALGDTSPDDLQALQSDIEKAEQQEQKLGQQASAMDKQVKDLSQKLVKAAAAVRASETELDEIEAAIAESVTEERAKAEQLAKRTESLQSSLAALARIARQPDMGVGGAMVSGSGPLIDRIRSANLLADMTPALKQEMAALGIELNELAALRAELETKRQARAEKLAGLADKQAALDKLLRERKLQTADLRAKQADEQSRITSLTKQAKSLEQLISALENQAKMVRPHPKPKVRGAIARVRPTPKPGTEPASSSPLIAADEAAPSQPSRPAAFKPDVAFSSYKGRLRLPVHGKIVRGYGTRGTYGNKGVELAVRPGAQVIAPVDAQILFAGPFRSYGGLIILSVGEGYHLLVAGLDQIDAIAGQKLIAGEPVGRLANAAKSAMIASQNSQDQGLKARLYVELRRNGKPLNPLPWLKGSP